MHTNSHFCLIKAIVKILLLEEWKKVATTCQRTDIKHNTAAKLIGNDNTREFSFDLIYAKKKLLKFK